jgi:dimethylglycine dehydrogenase
VRGNEPIFCADQCVGLTTSGGYGHFVKKSLGFGYVTPNLAEPGTELEVGLLDDRCKATVIKEPAHDPANKRLRA